MSCQSVNVLIVLLVCIYWAAAEITCENNCAILHPQQHFCNADISFKVRVQSSSYINRNHAKVWATDSKYLRYEAEVIVPLKGSHWYQPGAIIYFYSPTSGFTCTISSLDEGGVYLIAGQVHDGLLVVTECDGLAIKWDDLTSTQKAGVKGRYQQYCNSCEINKAGTTLYIGSDRAEKGYESGYWKTEGCFYNPIPSHRYGGEDCETRYSTCRPDRSLGRGQCSWTQSQEYVNCAELRESAWFLGQQGAAAFTFTCRSQCRRLTSRPMRQDCAKQVRKLERIGYRRC